MKNIFFKFLWGFFLILVSVFFGKKYFSKPVSVFSQTSSLAINGGFECDTKYRGDTNCDGNINDDDYKIFKCEFLNQGRCSDTSIVSQPTDKSSDFNSDQKVDLIDFEIWRKNYFSLNNNSTPTPISEISRPIICPTCPPGFFCPQVCYHMD